MDPLYYSKLDPAVKHAEVNACFNPRKLCFALLIILGIGCLLAAAGLGGTGLFAHTQSLPQWLANTVRTIGQVGIGHSGR